MRTDIALRRNIISIYGQDGEAWLKDLPSTINHLAELWGFQEIKPFGNLTYNYCASVSISGSEAGRVLKISADSKRYKMEIQALKAFGSGVPKIYFSDDDHRAFLMEKLSPGFSLKNLVLSGEDDKATQMLAECILNLHKNKPQADDSIFKHLKEWIPDFETLRGFMPENLRLKGMNLFKELCSDTLEDRLLHFDLHHDNIISDGDSWKAIDPHGYIGDPVAEIGTMIRNPWDAFPENRSLEQIVDRRIEIMHDVLSFDLYRMNTWAFCVTLLSEVWSIQHMGHKHKVDINFLETLERRTK
jgi:streptomycin 6-kinase